MSKEDKYLGIPPVSVQRVLQPEVKTPFPKNKKKKWKGKYPKTLVSVIKKADIDYNNWVEVHEKLLPIEPKGYETWRPYYYEKFSGYLKLGFHHAKNNKPRLVLLDKHQKSYILYQPLLIDFCFQCLIWWYIGYDIGKGNCYEL